MIIIFIMSFLFIPDLRANMTLSRLNVHMTHLGILVKFSPDSVGLEQGTEDCISNPFPGDAQELWGSNKSLRIKMIKCHLLYCAHSTILSSFAAEDGNTILVMEPLTEIL